MDELYSKVIIPPFDDISIDDISLRRVAGIIMVRKPQVIVEAGTYRGHFAALAAASVGPTVSVYTADPTAFVMTPWPEQITFHHGCFLEMLALYREELEGKVEFAFIDSGPPCTKDHKEWSTIRIDHYEAVKSYLTPDGLIMVHDTNATDWEGANQIIAEAFWRTRQGRGLTAFSKDPPDAYLPNEGVRPRGPVQDHADSGRGLQT
jgi:hypothetical protein